LEFQYHETLFEFPQAFTLNQRWLERHPEDLAALSDFAEKHFTTGRFGECEQRIALLLANPAVEPTIQIGLRAIQIANSLALGISALVPGRIDAMVEGIANQSEGFKVGWSFKGTRYFINNNETLAPYRPWLMRLFDAVEGADRHAILSALQEVRASLPVEVKR
jgi:hypothetical protein